MSRLTARQREQALIILSVLLLIGLTAFSYFVLYKPAKDARLQAERTLSSEEQVVMALEEQLSGLPDAEPLSVRRLQQQVPVESLTDLIVLQLEQAETVSGTLIDSIAFTEAPLEPAAPPEGVENLQEVLTSVSFQALDYDSITAFIDEVEKMERILIVESIQFDSYPEKTTSEPDQDPIIVTLDFSAFFRPDLSELDGKAPKVETPVPAGKADPLPRNDGTNLEEEEAEPVPEEEPEVDVDVDVEVDTASEAAE